jgi:hypothetical protein
VLQNLHNRTVTLVGTVISRAYRSGPHTSHTALLLAHGTHSAEVGGTPAVRPYYGAARNRSLKAATAASSEAHIGSSRCGTSLAGRTDSRPPACICLPVSGTAPHAHCPHTQDACTDLPPSTQFHQGNRMQSCCQYYRLNLRANQCGVHIHNAWTEAERPTLRSRPDPTHVDVRVSPLKCSLLPIGSLPASTVHNQIVSCGHVLLPCQLHDGNRLSDNLSSTQYTAVHSGTSVPRTVQNE